MSVPRRVLHLVRSGEAPDPLRELPPGDTVFDLPPEMTESDYDRLLESVLGHDLVVPW